MSIPDSAVAIRRMAAAFRSPSHLRYPIDEANDGDRNPMLDGTGRLMATLDDYAAWTEGLL